MRVIAGTAKGIRLESPKGRAIRPTLDRVREALFSILAPRLEGARFLDLFAGTGANGVEALSRGAAWCTFVDHAPVAMSTMARNLQAAKCLDRAERLRLELPGELSVLRGRAAPYDIVFADPPYGFAQYAPLVTQVRDMALLVEGGVLVVEHASRAPITEAAEGLTCSREARYGDTTLSFFS